MFAAAIGPLAACSGTSNPSGSADAGPDGASAEGGKPEAGPRDGGSVADADAAIDAGNIIEAGHDASDGSATHDAAEGGPTGDAAEAAAPNAALALSAGANGNACAITVADGVECWTYNGSGVAAAPVAGVAGSVTALSGGGGFTDDYEAATDVFFCAITGAGGLDCWGNNVDSELGNGSQTNTAIYTVPGLVTGLTSGVTAVSAGDGNSVSACAVVGGDVQCWGNNGGVLGNGTTASTSALPVPVTGFTGSVTAVSVGGGFACALVTGGGVECWGTNTYGELGNGTTASSVTPVPVTGLTSGVTAISAAANSACALTSGGAVWCWGYGGDGELGNGATGNSSVPVQVMNLTSGVTALSAAGKSACAVIGGGVECWGYNADGELGNSSTTSSPIPVQVATLASGVTSVSVGFYPAGYACALTAGGGVWCWGNGHSDVPFHIAGFPD
jgi:hypothetical protein